MKNKLTESSPLHFLRYDRKHRQYLDHNLNNQVRHRRSRCDPSVHLNPAEKTFDAVKGVDEVVWGSARIFRCLEALGVKVSHTRERGHGPK